MRAGRFFAVLCMAAIAVPAFVGTGHGAGSAVVEAEGYSCMGEEKSRKEAKDGALIDAKKKASEAVLSHIKSETRLDTGELVKDIVEAYSASDVKIIENKELGWYKDEHAGECFKVWIRAEIVPDEKALAKAGKGASDDNPAAPLNVKVWTDKKEYRKGDRIKIFIKGNKPFYGRVVYKDASGNSVQLLPNPYRRENYFNGGVIYEVPAGGDKFVLEVAPPFGSENVMVYASVSELGEIGVKAEGGVYEVTTVPADIGRASRAIKVKFDGGRSSGTQYEASKVSAPSEFFEETVEVKTGE